VTIPIRVLLADDEKIFVESLARLLRRWGMAVQTVNDGRQAVECAGRERFDVLVLDLRMPVMTGLEALESIRQTDGLTPIILLTGQTDLEPVTKSLKGGSCEVLLKPSPVEAIVSAIENAFERKAAAQEFSARQNGRG
jgi:DNA-binding NtrC family response regulator